MHHHRFFTREFSGDIRAIPKSIKLASVAFFFYVCGWAVVEPYFSIYVYNFLQNYTLVGLFFAIGNIITLFLSIPIGDLADKVKPSIVFIIGLLLYPFIGFLYAVLTTVTLLFMTRALNGIFNPFVWVGGEAIIRKNSLVEKSSEEFGFYDTMKNLGAIFGAVLGIFLLSIFTINNLFFSVIPFSLLAAVVILKIRDKTKSESLLKGVEEVIEKDGFFIKELRDLKKIGFKAFYLIFLIFFTGVLVSLGLVFLPLQGLEIEMQLFEVGILYILLTIPFLFSFLFSEIADRKEKTNILIAGLFLLSVPIGTIFFFYGNQLIFLIATFLIGLFIALIMPVINGLITNMAPSTEGGEITGITYASKVLGFVVGPLFAGIVSDTLGIGKLFLFLAIIIACLAGITFLVRNKIR
jgi:MFS family permease